MSWRVLITDGLAPEGRSLLEAEAEVIETGLDSSLGAVDAVIVRSRTRLDGSRIRQAGPRLKVIGRAGVGVDNIDLEAARENQVLVVNAPEATTNAVAEHTLALMFALARQLPQADAGTHAGEWNKSALIGEELSGKTLGVIGAGRIGSLVADRAVALGMRVLAYDPYLDEGALRRRGVEPTRLDELLQGSDIVSVHVPLADDTKALLDAEKLTRIKRGAWVISTSRGGVIDEQALIEALEDGRVGKTALDVFTQEPPVGSGLLNQENAILTPHIGGQTRQAQSRVARDIASEVLAALRGDELRWRII